MRNNFRIFGSDRIRSNVYSKNRFVSCTFSSEDPLFDLRDWKLDPGTAVVANLTGSTGPPHDRLLVVAVEENVDRAGGDARTAVHAYSLLHNLCDQVAEDLESYRTSLPAFSLRTGLQRLRWRRDLSSHFFLVLLLRDLRRSSRTRDAEDILVILLQRRLSQPLRRPYQPVPSILCNIILDCLLQCKLRTVICAKMAKTATPVEVFRKPAVSALNDRDTFFWAYPCAHSAAGASVEMEEVSSSESFLDRVSLLWKF